MTDVADLAGLASRLDWPDHDSSTRAHDALLAAPDLDGLGRLVVWLAGVQAQFPVREIRRPRLIVVVADHDVAATGVSRLTPAETARAVAAITDGGGALNGLAEQAGAGIRVEAVDARSDITAAIARGAAIADDEIDAGTDLIMVGNLGAGSTTTAATIVSVLAGVEPIKVIGRGGYRIDDTAWMHKVAAVRDGRRQAWPHRAEPTDLLATLQAADAALLVGLLLRAAARRTPVLLDGLVAASAALVANSAKPGARQWWRQAQRGDEPGIAITLNIFDLDPILDLSIATGDGRAALIALGLVRAAILLARPIVAPAPPDPAVPSVPSVPSAEPQ